MAALTTDIETEATATDFFKIQKIGLFFSRILGIALVMGALITLGMLIWGAIDWITSGGDKAKYEEARKKITTAIIGLALLAVVWLLWRLVLYFLGVGTPDPKGGIIFFPNLGP